MFSDSSIFDSGSAQLQHSTTPKELIHNIAYESHCEQVHRSDHEAATESSGYHENFVDTSIDISPSLKEEYLPQSEKGRACSPGNQGRITRTNFTDTKICGNNGYVSYDQLSGNNQKDNALYFANAVNTPINDQERTYSESPCGNVISPYVEVTKICPTGNTLISYEQNLSIEDQGVTEYCNCAEDPSDQPMSDANMPVEDLTTPLTLPLNSADSPRYEFRQTTSYTCDSDEDADVASSPTVSISSYIVVVEQKYATQTTENAFSQQINKANEPVEGSSSSHRHECRRLESYTVDLDVLDGSSSAALMPSNIVAVEPNENVVHATQVNEKNLPIQGKKSLNQRSLIVK